MTSAFGKVVMLRSLVLCFVMRLAISTESLASMDTTIKMYNDHRQTQGRQLYQSWLGKNPQPRRLDLASHLTDPFEDNVVSPDPDPPSMAPSTSPTISQPPSPMPTKNPTEEPTPSPSLAPSPSPTEVPSTSPTLPPTPSPTISPTQSPTMSPMAAFVNNPTNDGNAVQDAVPPEDVLVSDNETGSGINVPAAAALAIGGTLVIISGLVIQRRRLNASNAGKGAFQFDDMSQHEVGSTDSSV